MAVNEAPRLTPRVVALLMVGVFVVCLCADRMQCVNNGRQSMCIGKTPYSCDYEYCRESVSTPTTVSSSTSCMGKGDAVVIVALVEVGPSVTSPRSASITSHMADELRKRVNSGAFLSDARKAVGRASGDLPDTTAAALPIEVLVSDYAARWLIRVPRARTRVVVTHDAVPLLPVDNATAGFAYTSWEEAVNTALPVSRRSKAAQLPQYFPGLYAALQNVSEERAASTASAAVRACDSVVLLVGILVHATAAVQTVWQTPWNANEDLRSGASHVTGAVTRYLMTSRGALKYVQRVQYYQYSIGLPEWRFECRNPAPTSREPGVVVPAAAAAAASENGTATGASEVCAPQNATFSSATCQSVCAVHDAHRETIAVVNAARPRRWVAGLRFGRPAYQSTNCYQAALSSLAPSGRSCAFEAETVKRVLDDCLHLSPEGARAAARCLLDQS